MNLTSSKAPTIALTLVSAIWLSIVCVLAQRFNVPSSDGILYSLPLAHAKHPFDLGVPYLNDFEGYGSSWGHQWPGSMWLRALVFMILPYSRVADVAVLSLFQLLTAFTAAGLVFSATAKVIPSLAALVMILSDRLLLLACTGNRFESPAVALVLLLFANAVTDFSKHHRGWRWLILVAAFLCPTLHPYGLALGGLILSYEILVIRSQPDRSRVELMARLAAFTSGCAALILWFLAQPDAWKQFAANMALQKSFYQNWNSVVAGLGNYRIWGGPVLWGAGLICVCMLVAGWPKAKREGALPLSTAWRFLAPVLFLTVILIHTVTRCENFTYLAFGSPFAVMMVCIAATRLVACMPPPIRWIPAVSIASITLLHASILPHRLLQFWKAGMPDMHQTYSNVLRALPPGSKVFIPHSLWPAATEDTAHNIRWFTFPIASRKEVRESYEHLAYANVKPGDILVIENSGAGKPDRFGLYPTFKTTPPDPAHWRHLRTHRQIFAGAIPWGIDLSIYEFIR